MSYDEETLDEARARNVRDALREDIGPCDWTAQLIPEDQRAQATVCVRETAVLCGQAWFDQCIQSLDASAQILWNFRDGDIMAASDEVCRIQANTRAILTAERAALNFLQCLSGVATVVRRYVDVARKASPHTTRGCAVLDTRKTLPGLRLAQKYAVKVGGGENQRLALYAGILIKENHIAAAGGIARALAQAQALNTNKLDIQIEVENLNQLQEALDAGATSILLDNFDTSQMQEAVAITQSRAVLETSGGVTLEQLHAIVSTGVDRVSIGRLTKDITATDYSMRVMVIQ